LSQDGERGDLGDPESQERMTFGFAHLDFESLRHIFDISEKYRHVICKVKVKEGISHYRVSSCCQVSEAGQRKGEGETSAPDKTRVKRRTHM
jgi:hypothetical protein